jgi:hypothetical protein
MIWIAGWRASRKGHPGWLLKEEKATRRKENKMKLKVTYLKRGLNYEEARDYIGVDGHVFLHLLEENMLKCRYLGGHFPFYLIDDLDRAVDGATDEPHRPSNFRS